MINYYAFQKFSAPFSIKNLDEIPPKYTAIILGAGLRKDSTPTSILAERLEAGVALYKAGKVKKILVSGDNRTHGYDEPESMKRYLLAKGISAEDIFLDYAGFDTYSTIYRAKNVFQIQDAILVSQQYHLDRALYIGRHLSMDVRPT
jgi:SanA protein